MSEVVAKVVKQNRFLLFFLSCNSIKLLQLHDEQAQRAFTGMKLSLNFHKALEMHLNYIIKLKFPFFYSTTSSIRSYSSRRFEQEVRDKELRQEMKKQLCRLQEQQQLQKMRPTIIIGDSIPPFTIQSSKLTPHILTPNSTDELLPSVEENDEFSPQFDRKNP